MDADERTKREAIIAACLEMNRSGLNQGTSGNISVRHGEGLLITPTAIAYERLQPEDIVFLAMDGTATGRHRPSSEWRFHRDILAARPDAHAVVHAHPTACTTLAILNREIPAVHYMIAAAGGPTVRVAPYAIYGSEELSHHAVAALEGRLACLLEHHGMIAIGPSLARTMWTAVEVETLARQYLGCLQVGEVRILSDEQIAAVVEKFAGYGLQV
ncbi:class II aldolase/adducin family protein [Cereibacter azotoformans]|uniref:class II aldolase/adducin family protein n=1 Tax=Cereibacter TaxID=1653176 RepID=UPI0011A68FF6|nr:MULTISPECIES: class II aldolase/adducin family protein [Cereibacter]ULB10503.1 class II aldolase/adducin family protein [Cereibacter azotoformans]